MNFQIMHSHQLSIVWISNLLHLYHNLNYIDNYVDTNHDDIYIIDIHIDITNNDINTLDIDIKWIDLSKCKFSFSDEHSFLFKTDRNKMLMSSYFVCTHIFDLYVSFP